MCKPLLHKNEAQIDLVKGKDAEAAVAGKRKNEAVWEGRLVPGVMQPGVWTQNVLLLRAPLLAAQAEKFGSLSKTR